MPGKGHYLFAPLLLLISACSANNVGARRVMAWTGAAKSIESAAQFNNQSWAGLFDGVFGFCGADIKVKPDNKTAFVFLNTTMYPGKDCSAIYDAVKSQGKEFHICVTTVPQAAIDNPGPLISQAVALAEQHGWDGYNIDDESHVAPRGTIAAFEAWVGFINAFADGLHEHGLKLSADIQSITLPYGFKPNKSLRALLTSSSIDKWINMDTYYFGTGRFLDALDYYSTAMPVEKCGIGMMNRADITTDGYLARFHAIRASGAMEIDMFNMPIDDKFLPYLWKYKTGCAGCPNGGALSCWSNLECK